MACPKWQSMPDPTEQTWPRKRSAILEEIDMESQATESIKTVEPLISEGKKSRLAASLAFLQSTPKWAQIVVPALAVAIGVYGYLHQGQKGSQHDSVARQSPVAGPYGVPMAQGAMAPVEQLANATPGAYGPYYGNYYAPYYGSSFDAYSRGNGYGHGHGRSYGHGNGRMNASFSFGGNMSGGGDGYGNGYGRNGGWW
jgi:hypothetical protein